jgi:hypothetical protein
VPKQRLHRVKLLVRRPLIKFAVSVQQIGHDSFPFKNANVTPVLEMNDSQPVLVPPGTNGPMMLRLRRQSTCARGSEMVPT